MRVLPLLACRTPVTRYRAGRCIDVADIVLTLRLDDAEAAVLLADIAAHRKRDQTDGHRDSGVLLIDTASVISAVQVDPT